MTNEFTCCISCGSEKIKKFKGKFAVAFHDRRIIVPGIEYYACTECGENFMNLENESKIDAFMKAEKEHALSAKS